MYYSQSSQNHLLVTTSSYRPSQNFVSSLTLEVERILKLMGQEYDLYVSDNSSRKTIKKKYKRAIHIDPFIGASLRDISNKQMNFISTKDSLQLNRNIFSRLTHSYMKSYLKSSNLNLFFNEKSMEQTLSFLKEKKVSRDYHVSYFEKDIRKRKGASPKEISSGPIKLCALIGENKNNKSLECFRFSKEVAITSGRSVEFLTDYEIDLSSKLVSVKKINSTEKDEVFESAHFNLLFLDQSTDQEEIDTLVCESINKGVIPVVCFRDVSDCLKIGKRVLWQFDEVTRDGVQRWWKTITEESFQLDLLNIEEKAEALYNSRDLKFFLEVFL